MQTAEDDFLNWSLFHTCRLRGRCEMIEPRLARIEGDGRKTRLPSSYNDNVEKQSSLMTNTLPCPLADFCGLRAEDVGRESVELRQIDSSRLLPLDICKGWTHDLLDH